MVHVLMLRGINLGPSRRVGMADLRALLAAVAQGDVCTYLQSGNAVLRSDATPEELEASARALISQRFGFDVPVVGRTGPQLAAVVEGNPLAHLATDPRRHQVSFLSAPLEPAVVQRLEAAVVAPEALAIDGREVHAWHPDGVARSRLAMALAGDGLGVTATARNWRTVTALLALADCG